jgi:glycosyltransferase involved in cell wall biosynthesis
MAPALRIMAGNDAENRRLLETVRGDPEYELAFAEPDPLVTVIVPTNGRIELLTSRTLPSVLAQTHARLEILVIGDATDSRTEAALNEIDDSRVRFVNLTQRYVYPDPHRHRLAAATLARNEGYRLARGRWLFDVDDDDEVPVDAIERLLEAARERRLEAVQGVVRRHAPEAPTRDLVPTTGRPSLNGALVHSHLRFFTREHVASAFGIGGDVFRGERMVRAGVRVGLLDRVTYEYYPATLWLRS